MVYDPTSHILLMEVAAPRSASLEVCRRDGKIRKDSGKTIGLLTIVGRAGLTYLGRVCTVLVGPPQFFTVKTDDLF